jgi:heat shock protein HslJ
MYRLPASQFGRRRLRTLALAALVIAGLAPAAEAQRGFPYDDELMLDARPMRGSKRVPSLLVKQSGEAIIEAWCNTVTTQFVIAADTITMSGGQRTEQQCTPERMKADDDLIAALVEITTWRRDGSVLTLRGPKALRFRSATH